MRQINVPRGEAGVLNRTLWDMRADPPVLPPAGVGTPGGGGRGRGGRGGGTAASAPSPAGEAQTAEAGAGLAGELNTEFGPAAGETGGRGGGGGGGRGGFGGGAPVDPGEYTVTIASAGKSDTRTVTVEEDPRMQLSPEDRARRRKAIDTLVSLVRAADEPARKAAGLTTALNGLTASWNVPSAAPVPDAVKKAVEDMVAKVNAAEAAVAVRGRGRRSWRRR